MSKTEFSLRHRIGDFSLEVSAQCAAGWTVMFGPSGAGKSTTLRCIAGLLRPQRGRVVCGATTWLDTEAHTCLPAQERRAGWVAQNAGLFPHLSVAENVAFGLRGISRSEQTDRAQHAMRVFHCEHFASRMPQQLSGGEKQRVALARAIAPGPTWLLLDEPFRGIDHSLRAAVLEDLRAWCAANPTVVLAVFHDPLEATAVNARVLRIREGRVVADGAARDVLAPELAALRAQLNAATTLRPIAE